MSQFLLATTLLLISPLLEAADTITLPVPSGWRVENTAYPPPWAKTLPWKGTIQLRFPKGFFEPESDYFWSYPILYQLKGDCIRNEEELRQALIEYDAGLYTQQYPKQQIKLSISPKKSADKYPLIVFDGFDPFTTKKPLRTWIVFHRRYEKTSDTTIVLLLRSSQQYNPQHPVWKDLTSQFRSKTGF